MNACVHSHTNPFGIVTHNPLFLQGLFRHGSPTSHMAPVYPGGHAHRKVVPSGIHVAPLRHSFVRQALMISHISPAEKIFVAKTSSRKYPPLKYFFTARKRSLGQGNIFAPVCHSVQGGSTWAGTPPPPGMYPLPRAGTPPLGMCTPWQLHPAWAGTPRLGRYTPGQVHPPTHLQSSACWEIRATSGRYAAYWNAFLFIELHVLSSSSLKFFQLKSVNNADP